jgi:hypothetical protein
MSRCLWAAALLAPLAVACSGGDGGAGSDGGAGDGGDRSDSSVPSTVDPSNRFADESQEWEVPDNGLDEGFVQPSSFASYRFWSLLDVDGDGLLDIAHTGAIDLTQSAWDAAGSPYWKLYRGSSDRWSDSSVEWKVPPSGATSGFFAISATGSGEWRTFDITGDGRPDLVQTSDPETGYVWDPDGNPYWKVFVNDGEGGFTRPAQSWPVPDSGTSYGFNTTSYASSYWYWTTLDMNGDDLPDLVHTADPATGTVWDASGSPHWKVFLSEGDGFRRQATIWPVPDSGMAEGFYTWGSASSYGKWLVTDLDDDGRTDLVQTGDPSTGYVWDAAGEPYWKVFAGDGERFAASPDKWAVPDNGMADGFSTATSLSSSRLWTIIDIDGDRDLDLVQTGDVSHTFRVWDATGDPYWKVYRNLRDGFSDELHRWPVPDSGTDEGYYMVEGSASYSTWFTRDVDDDGHPDLVQTEDPSTGRVWDATGSPYWKVFHGEE